MKRPSFQFYPQDWLADRNVIAMTNEERGGYIQLLCMMWMDENCELPSDDEYLSRVSGISKGGLGLVKCCFKQSATDPQKITHKRLLLERQKQDEWKKKSIEGGKKSALKRASNKPLSKGGSTTPPTNPQPKGNSSTSSSTKKNINKKKFEDFVLLTEIELKTLNEKYGETRTKDYIARLNNYIGSTGKTYKSHYHTILNWMNKEPVAQVKTFRNLNDL